MTYDEMLQAQNQTGKRGERMPYGTLYKKQTEGKYHFVLALRTDLTDDKRFLSGLNDDQQQQGKLHMKQLLRYEVKKTERGETELTLEAGSYQTLAQLLDNDPAIVAKAGFTDHLAEELLEMVGKMHQQQVYYGCFAPQNILIRKGDEAPMLLLCGSSFPAIGAERLFAEERDFLAPEVLEGQPFTAASDIWSLGKLFEWLHAQGSMAYEYKKVVKKATAEQPEKRFATAEKMRESLVANRARRRSFVTFVAACTIALIGVWLFFDMMPKAEDIEFVEAPPKEEMGSLLDDGIDMDELAMYDVADSLADGDSIDAQAVEVYMKKAEEIFRKQFRKEADRILGTVYNKHTMNLTEKKFMAATNTMRDELLKAQEELAGEAGLSDDKARRIASEVIDIVTREKEQELEREEEKEKE